LGFQLHEFSLMCLAGSSAGVAEGRIPIAMEKKTRVAKLAGIGPRPARPAWSLGTPSPAAPGGRVGLRDPGRLVLELGSELVYFGVNAARTTTDWTGKPFESAASGTRSGVEEACKRIGSCWDSARQCLGR
jgi:hypothetical protein